MKKLLFVAVTALTAGIVKKKLDDQGADQRLWAEATDAGTGAGSVAGSGSGTGTGPARVTQN
ncbi:DLW-39 family protein [Knoellia remsis]|uniref:DLW-39 family protein n=1 Tax=Knoellia remsis TaxID=407159 RepID=UPI001C45B531